MVEALPEAVYLVMSPSVDLYDRVQSLRVFEVEEEAEVYCQDLASFYKDDPAKPRKVKRMWLSEVMRVAKGAKHPTRVTFCRYDRNGRLEDVEVLRDPAQYLQ